MVAPPIEYIWHLTLQPLSRPSCYEDDPMQLGISSGPPFGGCWLVDDVRLDERRGGGDDDRTVLPNGPDSGGAERKHRLATPVMSRLERRRPAGL